MNLPIFSKYYLPFSPDIYHVEIEKYIQTKDTTTFLEKLLRRSDHISHITKFVRNGKYRPNAMAKNYNFFDDGETVSVNLKLSNAPGGEKFKEGLYYLGVRRSKNNRNNTPKKLILAKRYREIIDPQDITKLNDEKKLITRRLTGLLDRNENYISLDMPRLYYSPNPLEYRCI